jgi:hypothetical protein
VTPGPRTLPYLSVAGRDPIWNTGSPPGLLTPAQFTNGDSVDEHFSEGGGEKVSAVLHSVAFDNDVGCWYADIDLSKLTDVSYFPFVRLGLARYQANTVASIERLSPPVVSDPIQIFPTRELSIHRSAGHASVTVSGQPSDASRPTTIQVELQMFDGNPAAAANALIGRSGWHMLARAAGALGSTIDVQVPAPGARQMRLVVTETESYPSEGGASGGATSRLVYADIVPL